ncbi:MAG TPA: hypothetical protein PLY95_03790, partial [Candidatus Paceibacterota bacterium]|nr:hypothetical protein [Candidatus Paceibacterota bacterium]
AEPLCTSSPMRFLICKNMIEVVKENDFIIFKNVAPAFDYDVALKAVKIEGFENWLEHLRQKNWWDKSLEADFIRLYNEWR